MFLMLCLSGYTNLCCLYLLQLRPNFADAWSNLASAYMRKGRLTEAAQCCRQALALNPLLVSFLFLELFGVVLTSLCPPGRILCA